MKPFNAILRNEEVQLPVARVRVIYASSRDLREFATTTKLFTLDVFGTMFTDSTP